MSTARKKETMVIDVCDEKERKCAKTMKGRKCNNVQEERKVKNKNFYEQI